MHRLLPHDPANLSQALQPQWSAHLGGPDRPVPDDLGDQAADERLALVLRPAQVLDAVAVAHHSGAHAAVVGGAEDARALCKWLKGSDRRRREEKQWSACLWKGPACRPQDPSPSNTNMQAHIQSMQCAMLTKLPLLQGGAGQHHAARHTRARGRCCPGAAGARGPEGLVPSQRKHLVV